MSWHTLHEYSPSNAHLAAGFLDGFGIDLRIVDGAGLEIARDRLPSMRSPVCVQVRQSDRAVAEDIVSEALRAPERQKVDTSIDRLGLTIRACAMSTFFAPLGLVLAPKYLARAARATTRPREHGWTIAGIVACVPACLAYGVVLHHLLAQ